MPHRIVNKKETEGILAVLSVFGIHYLVKSITQLLIFFDFTLTQIRIAVFGESALILAIGILFWQFIPVKKSFKKIFLIVFPIVMILDLAYKLVILF